MPKKTACIALNASSAGRLAAEFIRASKWFECEPLPDDEYRFVLKDEPGLNECIAKADVTVLRELVTHYRCHQETFAVCGATEFLSSQDEKFSDVEEETTCPECLRVNADARR